MRYVEKYHECAYGICAEEFVGKDLLCLDCEQVFCSDEHYQKHEC